MKRAPSIPALLLMVVTALLAMALILPVIPTSHWAVRILEFPRLQLTLVTLGLALLTLFTQRHTSAHLVGGAGLLAVAWSGFVLWPHVWPGTSEDFATCDDPLDVLVVNVRKSNRDADAVRQLVADSDADVVLLMETDTWWDAQLQRLESDYPSHVEAVSSVEDHYGMHLFARAELTGGIEFLVPDDVPSVFARLPDGTRLVALHPRPPQLGQSSELRDQQLERAARRLEQEMGPALVMGDLNTVPWEQLFERFTERAGLVDPRESLGRLSSFAPQGLRAWPLDHILWTDDLQLAGFELGQDIGSDHLPVQARLCRTDGLASLEE